MKGIDTKYFLMDAGSVVWRCDGAAGSAPGHPVASSSNTGSGHPAASSFGTASGHPAASNSSTASGHPASSNFGTALGQLRAQLAECGRVVPASDLAPGDLPSCATPCDFVVLRHGLFHWGYVTVRLEESEGSWLVTFQASARNVSARLLRDILRHLA